LCLCLCLCVFYEIFVSSTLSVWIDLFLCVVLKSAKAVGSVACELYEYICLSLSYIYHSIHTVVYLSMALGLTYAFLYPVSFQALRPTLRIPRRLMASATTAGAMGSARRFRTALAFVLATAVPRRLLRLDLRVPVVFPRFALLHLLRWVLSCVLRTRPRTQTSRRKTTPPVTSTPVEV